MLPLPDWAEQIGPTTLLLIGEAGMADTPTLNTAVTHVLKQGGRVCLVGDDQQLGAIGAGGILADLEAAHGAVRLTQLHRITDPGSPSPIPRPRTPSQPGAVACSWRLWRRTIWCCGTNPPNRPHRRGMRARVHWPRWRTGGLKDVEGAAQTSRPDPRPRHRTLAARPCWSGAGLPSWLTSDPGGAATGRGQSSGDLTPVGDPGQVQEPGAISSWPRWLSGRANQVPASVPATSARMSSLGLEARPPSFPRLTGLGRSARREQPFRCPSPGRPRTRCVPGSAARSPRW